MRVAAVTAVVLATLVSASAATAAKKPPAKKVPTLSGASGKSYLSRWARGIYEGDSEIASFAVTGCYSENKQRVTCLVSFTSVRFGPYWSVCKSYQSAYVTNRSATIRRTPGRVSCTNYGR